MHPAESWETGRGLPPKSSELLRHYYWYSRTMHHACIQVLVAVMLPARVLLRLTTAAPAHVPGPVWEKFAATLSHVALCTPL